MYKELTYQTLEGFTVFTSQYLKNRGTCCKSACIHCPFGYTVKKHGLQFAEILEEDFLQIETILNESNQVDFDWKSYWPQDIRFILLKGNICGFFVKNKIVIKSLFLKPHFQQQNLSRELIEAYFF
jgi:hypothetical protein